VLDETDGAGAPQALSWSWELDFAALMDSLNEPGPHEPAGPSAAPSGNAGEGARDVVPDDLEDEGVPGELIPVGVLAGRVAEKLAPGPDLAAWLSLVPAAELGDADLVATAGAWRRMAAWAQAKELAAVAQIASRSAARDEDIGTGPDGRPARIPASAAAEVALELTMSRYGASWWAGLAVDLMVPPALARSAEGGAGPVPGLLDVSLPWLVLAGASPGPGYLGRIGPVPAIQARRLAAYAAGDPAAEWRIIVTTSAGHAIAVTRIRRPRDQPGAGIGPGASGGRGLGLVGRVTLTIPADILTRPPSRTGNQTRPGAGLGTEPPAEILRLALQAAGRAAARARDTAADDAAAGGCAHSSATPGYRPPPRLRDHVAARDLTCRSPVCRQPAWRGELDHTIPWDEGLTCACNLGGVCKADHLLKHHPDWKLEQTAPGFFRWTTPSGRTFTITPDTHPL
jgi:hypothetical protein